MNRFFVLFVFILMGCNSSTPEVKNSSKSDIQYRAYTNKQLAEFCKKKFIDACATLGHFFRKEGLYEVANVYYKTGCFYNDFSSCASVDTKINNPITGLPKMLLEGLCFPKANLAGCPNYRKPTKDEINKVNKYKMECNKNKDSDKCKLYSLFLFQTDKHDEATKYLKKSCDLGQITDCDNLAIVHYIKGRKKQGINMLNKLCYKNNFIPSCFYAGILQMRSKDKTGANKALTKACNNNYKDACSTLMSLKSNLKFVPNSQL